MTFRPNRMKFGVFMAPFHRVGEKPTVALERDLELIEHLDRLDFDEAWIGEHHSAGWEIIASPEVMIAAAAQRTRTINLGTGVSSLPYHHPFILADRMMQLDHLTRGRAMFGVGPGALTSDAYMMGIEALTQRQRMDESLGAILALFRGETVTMKTDWFTLQEARLQLAPYTYPHMPVAVASTFSPAGRHRPGSMAWVYSRGRIPARRNDFAPEDVGDVRGRGSRRRATCRDRNDLAPRHPVPSLGDARAGASRCRGGQCPVQHRVLREHAWPAGRPQRPGRRPIAGGLRRRHHGTPDDAIGRSNGCWNLGGFGSFSGLAHEWTTWEKTKHSFELWARYVAPHFQGQLDRVRADQAFVAENRASIFGPNLAAIGKAFVDAGVEFPSRGWSACSEATPKPGTSSYARCIRLLNLPGYQAVQPPSPSTCAP